MSEVQRWELWYEQMLPVGCLIRAPIAIRAAEESTGGPYVLATDYDSFHAAVQKAFAAWWEHAEYGVNKSSDDEEFAAALRLALATEGG